jgi:hypothetical protein
LSALPTNSIFKLNLPACFIQKRPTMFYGLVKPNGMLVHKKDGSHPSILKVYD